MKVSIGEPKYPGSSPDELALAYLDYSIQISNDGFIFFSKLEVLKNPSLLFEVAKVLAIRLMPEVTHICVLASSGLAMGVAVSLIAKLPLIFYRREGWPKPESSGLGSRFAPEIPLGAKVALVDSHEHTRYTSALCFDELFMKDIQVVQVLTPVSFDECIDPTWTRNIRYTSLADYSSLHEKIAKKYSAFVTSEQLRQIICANDNRFWLAPPIERDDNPYYEFDAPGIKERPKWFLGKTTNEYQFETISLDLNDLIFQERIKPDDQGRWAFFLRPKFVEELAKAAGKLIDLGEFDFLIGTSHLGTALAISLVWYNAEKFHGKILMHLGRDGFVPTSPDLSAQKILPIEMIITSGVYAVDIYLRVLELGGRIDRYITVFQPPSTNNWWIHSRLASLSRLSKTGIKFISFTSKDKFKPN